jgi:protein-tyrosine phosphatase
MDKQAGTRVLFVCLGNICRSPTAHGVFARMVERRQLTDSIAVDSCGTGAWHAGNAPDPRAIAEAAKQGYDLTGLRARQFSIEDFERFDYILAMDRMNLDDLRALCPDSYIGHLGLFLPFGGSDVLEEVPDPYYGGVDGFSHVLDLVEQASQGLLQEISGADIAQ